ncbi:hypothetical protein FHW72_001898 [Ochrobactrum sp. RC6B]|nr:MULTISPECIES: hypothetical protein [Brucella/Ochrobactrum group]MBB3216827.1 hypothetical protein [Ochrobactrum sp. RC6B]
MIKIRKKITVSDIEGALETVGTGTGSVLQLPNNIIGDEIGLEAALCQLAITWGRKYSGEARLKLYANSVDDVAVHNFANTVYGLTALNFANTIENNSANQETISRRNSMMKALSFLRAMDDGNLSSLKSIHSKKNVLPFLCLDNSENFSALRVFYNAATGKLRGLNEFTRFVERTIEEVRLAAWRKPDDSFVSNVASMLFEAFVNTQDHALSNIDNSLYTRSMRGVIFARKEKKRSELINDSEWSVPLHNYFSNFELQNPKAEKIAALEISIFDSGPGLAQTWLKREGRIERGLIEDGVTLDEEVTAFESCLRKGFSREKLHSRGYGLFRLMKAIKNEKGFIKFRSGRLAVAASIDSATEDEEFPLDLVDLRFGGAPQLAPFADGALITIVLPLNHKI